MLCECCQEHEATIHLTQVVNGQSKELHLCEECAEQSGLNLQGVMSLPEVLFGIPWFIMTERKCSSPIARAGHIITIFMKSVLRMVSLPS